ncbi:hypothetical protein RFI_28186 [Reticulomyxa filosa]|uniref:Poly [ADP-ribose] polymerase n=1 Tax=Reticulomyxa filosa TaxID=46433 RepID=X6M5E3_RETFI|nr:hypothetical protein RFI_28186 [Reticulomyxa filosa]|eukprot:ETO09203.1 hypothetical protein RFI_28186 [Reticulomyxa filosa]
MVDSLNKTIFSGIHSSHTQSVARKVPSHSFRQMQNQWTAVGRRSRAQIISQQRSMAAISGLYRTSFHSKCSFVSFVIVVVIGGEGEREKKKGEIAKENILEDIHKQATLMYVYVVCVGKKIKFIHSRFGRLQDGKYFSNRNRKRKNSALYPNSPNSTQTVRDGEDNGGCLKNQYHTWIARQFATLNENSPPQSIKTMLEKIQQKMDQVRGHTNPEAYHELYSLQITYRAWLAQESIAPKILQHYTGRVFQATSMCITGLKIPENFEWQYLDDRHCWISFDPEVASYVECRYQLKSSAIDYVIRDGYHMTLYVCHEPMVQQSHSSGRQKHVRRRIFCGIPTIPFERWKNVWRSKNELATLEEVALGTASAQEYKWAWQLFKDRGMPCATIMKIERIENSRLFNSFKDWKGMNSIRTNPAAIREHYLFHGTSPGCVAAIVQQGIDPRLSGTNDTAYGKGSYFAVHSSYSNRFCHESDIDRTRQMLLCRVKVGNYHLGHRDLVRPEPIKLGCHDLYDSCVNDLECPTIFVTFDLGQCYPMYLITYIN